MVSQEWLDLWPGCKQYSQTKHVSDRCAIIVKSSNVDWGPKLFRTLDFWLSNKGFGELVKLKWNSYMLGGGAWPGARKNLKC